MVTGRVPFDGITRWTRCRPFSQAVLTAVQLNAEVPAELERILGKCLEKDPSERYQDTRDLVVDLKRLKRDTDSQPVPRVASGPGSAALPVP